MRDLGEQLQRQDGQENTEQLAHGNSPQPRSCAAAAGLKLVVIAAPRNVMRPDKRRAPDPFRLSALSPKWRLPASGSADPHGPKPDEMCSESSFVPLCQQSSAIA